MQNVTKDNFLSVLKGDKGKMSRIGSGKVVESGPHDNIFINFVDHGQPGALYFPKPKLFYADTLIRTFREMYDQRKYRKIVFYIEACHAGSMFDGMLDDDKSIMAITASGPQESSYATYCDSNSGEYSTCLGDLFSVTWMENWDKSVVRQQDVAEFTLERQILNTKDPIIRKLLKKEIDHKKKMKQLVDKIIKAIYKKVAKEMPGVAAKIGTLEKPAYLPLNMDMFQCIVNRITDKCFSVSELTK
ncbi:uncharacterized protein LOC126837014 [Adelges cooleyi]|uniref:uncharacterized protein LOC126837014 n=1 Tax=Adelges cooleyi TaxID=133065 RepID=UPI00217FD0F0|nr:uncharacterized protein LOC126837014 [Adelges cooleyi]